VKVTIKLFDLGNIYKFLLSSMNKKSKIQYYINSLGDKLFRLHY